VIPNTRVKFIPALIAGIIAGTTFQLLQWGYVNFQSLLSGYGAVYGTFAAIPLFMIWLELSWLIVLVGAEISFAYQNAEHYSQEAEGVNVSAKQRRILSLLIAKIIVKNFTEGNQPLKAAEIAEEQGIPVRLVRDIIYDLMNAGIINETLTTEIREVAYQPALDPAKITVAYVIDRIDQYGHHSPFDLENEDLKMMKEIVCSFYIDLHNKTGKQLLKEL